MLPDVDVTTIIWADEERGCHWDAAQGDDLKNQCPAIELNFPRIMKNHEGNLATALIENWLSIYIVLSARQDLINHGVRRVITCEEEEEVCIATVKHILSNLDDNRDLVERAKKALIESRKVRLIQRKDLSDALDEALSEINSL